LFIGLGTGISLSGAGAFPEVQAEGVELLPEVAEVIPHFVPAMPGNVREIAADARRFVRETTNVYDVVIGDLFHPAADGAGFLYTVEHFRRVKERLSKGGLFCQWLPLHQLDLESVRVIARTFMEAFPEAEMWLLRPNIDAPVVGLVGWRGGRGEIANVEGRINDDLKKVGLTDSVRLYGNFLAGSAELKKFAGESRLNRDFFPIIVYEAPRFSFQRHSRTHERLMALVEIFGDSKFPAMPRVEKYIQARNVYLGALVTEWEGQQEKAIDGYVESARMSEDFTMGYAQCLTLASAWLKGEEKSERARKLLERLVEAQPKQRVAKDMLERLR
jgi:spermidine synthase